MHNEIEKPMREHSGCDNKEYRPTLCMDKQRDAATEQHGENQRTNQSMRIGHIIKIEIASLREARNDFHFFDSGHHRDRPHHVQPLDGDEEHPERNAAHSRFRAKGGPVVADEHATPLRPIPIFGRPGPRGIERCNIWYAAVGIAGWTGASRWPISAHLSREKPTEIPAKLA